MNTMNMTRLAVVGLFIFFLVACQSTQDESPATLPPATLPPATMPPPSATASESTPTAISATAVPATEVVETVTAAPPTAIPAPTETATVPGQGGNGESTAVFCPEVPRPALILFVYGQKYVLADPGSGQSCDLPVAGPLPGALQVADEHLFYQAFEGTNLVVQRQTPDGTVQALPFTALDTAQLGLFQNFAVSPDGRTIAWSYAGAKPDEPGMTVSELWVADVDSGTVTAQLIDFSAPDEGPHALVPVRFSDDGSTLYYSRQLTGIGGSWSAFVGRYDNLFSTPSAGGAVTPIFDCGEQGLFMCIGDFYLVEGQLANLAYTDDKAGSVVVLNGQGQVVNTLAAAADYVGYPTFSPTAELVFYSADLSEADILPLAAALQRVAPPTAPAEELISDPALLLPNRFLDGARLIVGYAPADGQWGEAIFDLTSNSLQPLSNWPTASVVGVMP